MKKNMQESCDFSEYNLRQFQNKTFFARIKHSWDMKCDEGNDIFHF